MLAFLFFSLKRAWQGFWRNALMSLAATATMVLMLLLLAGFWIIQTGLLAGLEFTEQKVEVVAYLHQNATESQINALAAEIEQLEPGFPRWVSPAGPKVAECWRNCGFLLSPVASVRTRPLGPPA